MFKSTSNNSQRRATISHSNELNNTAGIDPTVFASEVQPSERQTLVVQIQKFEQQLCRLSAQIKDAELRFHGQIPGRLVPISDSCFMEAPETSSSR